MLCNLTLSLYRMCYNCCSQHMPHKSDLAAIEQDKCVAHRDKRLREIGKYKLFIAIVVFL